MDLFSSAFPDHSLRMDAGDQIHLPDLIRRRSRIATHEPCFLGFVAGRALVARVGSVKAEILHRVARHRDVRD